VLNFLSQLPREAVGADRLDSFASLVAAGEIQEWYGDWLSTREKSAALLLCPLLCPPCA
jgi:hypothetical protein